MIPGGRMNPKQLKQMMKRMGIDQEELEGVEQVVVTLHDRELVFSEPSFTRVRAPGQGVSYQLVGEPVERKRQGAAPATPAKREIPAEDVELVVAKTGVSEARARKALEDADGEPAEAIIRLMSG